MKSPVDTVKGQIVDVDENGIVTIKVKYDDWFTLTKRNYRECFVQMIDARPLSDKQRKACYALIREISDWSGMSMDTAKDYMKMKYMVENIDDMAEDIFSLSNAPMSLVCAFQRFLVRFIIENDIPCSFPLLKYVDDVGDYIYGCLINKKCCVCGQHSDLHHVDAVGMGRDREEIIHEGMLVLPLCREHHTEIHMMGNRAFGEEYHFHMDDKVGVRLDKTLCRIYKLKRGKENAE